VQVPSTFRQRPWSAVVLGRWEGDYPCHGVRGCFGKDGRRWWEDDSRTALPGTTFPA
jgi:hypothetical protein